MVFRRFWTNWLQTYVTECHEFASACAGVKMPEIRERIISRIIALLSPSSPPRTSPSSSLGHSWPGLEWMVGPYYNLFGYDGCIWGFSQRHALCLRRSARRVKQTDRPFRQKLDLTSENMISRIITRLNTSTSMWFLYIDEKWRSDYSPNSSHQINALITSSLLNIISVSRLFCHQWYSQGQILSSSYHYPESNPFPNWTDHETYHSEPVSLQVGQSRKQLHSKRIWQNAKLLTIEFM